MFISPANPTFLYVKRGLRESPLNGLVNVTNVTPWLNKERRKVEKKYIVGELIQIKML